MSKRKIMSFAASDAVHSATIAEAKRLGINVTDFVTQAVQSKIDWSKIPQTASFPPMITNLQVTPVVMDPASFKGVRGVKVAFDWDQFQDCAANAPEGELAAYIGRQVVNALLGKLQEDMPTNWPKFENLSRTIDDKWEPSKIE